MPSTIILDDQVTYVTDPVSPCSGQPFSVSWQEKNIGDADSDAYQDIFDIDDHGTGDSTSLQCDPIAVGATAMRSATFTLPTGDYTMSLVINGKGPAMLGNVIVGDCF